MKQIELTPAQESKLKQFCQMNVQYNSNAIVPMNFKLINKNVETKCAKLIVCTSDYQILSIDYTAIDTFLSQCQILGTPSNLPAIADKELKAVKKYDLEFMRDSMMKSLEAIEVADGVEEMHLAAKKAKYKSDTVNTIIKVAMTELQIRKTL